MTFRLNSLLALLACAALSVAAIILLEGPVAAPLAVILLLLPFAVLAVRVVPFSLPAVCLAILAFAAPALAQGVALIPPAGSFLQEIHSALLPIVLQGLAALLTVLFGWATLTLKRKWGLDIEARHREALHSAIMSGVQAALEGDMTTSEMVEAAVAYARKSVPDAIKALSAPENVLRKLAEAKVQEMMSKLLPTFAGDLLTTDAPASA